MDRRKTQRKRTGTGHQRVSSGHATQPVKTAKRAANIPKPRPYVAKTRKANPGPIGKTRSRDEVEELLAIFEGAPVGMMLLDAECRVRRANRISTATVGIEARPGLSTGLAQALRCVQGVAVAGGCGAGPACAACTIRNHVLDTLRTGREHREVATALPHLGREGEEVLNLLVSTSRLVLRRRPYVLLTLQNPASLKHTEAALKASEATLKQTEQLAALGNWEWDLVADRHWWSDELYRIYGHDPGLSPVPFPQIKSYITPETWEGVASAVDKALVEGASYQCEAEIVRSDGGHRWITVRGESRRGRDGKIVSLHGTVQDITDRKLSEQRIARLNRAQAILAAVDHAIVHIHDQKQLLDEICRVAAEKGGFGLVWIGLVRPDGSVEPVSQAGETGYLEGIRIVVRDEPEGRGPVGTAVRERRPVIVHDIESDPAMQPWQERARQWGLQYVAAFPLTIGTRVVGAFQLYARQPGFFDSEGVRLLSQVTDDISFALTAIETAAERVRAERDLRKSEQELSDFFAAAPLGLLWVSPEGLIRKVNEAQLELLGRVRSEVLNHPVGEFHVEPEIVADVLARVHRRETVQNCRARIRRGDGAIGHVLLDANGFWDQDQLAHSRWFVRDVTHRVQLEREILTVSEREQRRLGHDLHDDLCQQLAGIEFLSQSLARDLASRSIPQTAQVVEIAQLVQHAMTQTRELARGLSPVGMEAEGLMEGLSELVARTRKVFRLDCRFLCPAPVLVPDHAVAIHIYRIAQEAVGNAVKHAKATQIEVGLTAAGCNLQLGIRDNGTGIPRVLPNSKGMGLRIMRYRAGVIGGSLVVQHNPEGGTTVICTVADGLVPPHIRNHR